MSTRTHGRSATLLLFLVLAASRASTQTAATIPPGLLREDFRIFRSALEEAHPGLYRYTSRAEMDRLFDQVEAGLTTDLDQQGAYLRFQPVIAAIRDGHTKFHPDTVWGGFSYFNRDRQIPLVLHVSGGRGWVLASTSSELPRGSQILSIEEQPFDAILQVLVSRSTFADGNAAGAREADVGNYFAGYYGNYIGVADTYRLSVLSADAAEPRIVLLPAVTVESLEALAATPAAGPAVSLSFPAPATALLVIRTFQTEGGTPFPRLLRQAFQEIAARGAGKLIIDLRDNEGGTDAYGALLYSYLAREPFAYYDRVEVTRRAPFSVRSHMDLPWFFPLYRMFISRQGEEYRWTHKPELRVRRPRDPNFTGRVIMLVNGRSFSVTSELAAVARSQDRAVFVGQETGGAYGGNTSGFFAITRLPNTHLVVGIPLWGYYTAVSDRQPMDRGVIPDHVVVPTIKDLMDGRDPALEMALGL